MYKIAIPSYNRANELKNKTLKTLIDGKVSPSRIYIFVANEKEREKYASVLSKGTYKELIVGRLGIANQRVFIKNYFKEGEHIVSIDDDVEEVLKMVGDKLVKIKNIDEFFKDAFRRIVREKLYIWGIYPVRNPFFMQNTVTTTLKFIIGALYGFIVRHDKSLEPSPKAEAKEDYEQSILYYERDGGVLRFNNVTIKTKFLAKGGLGQEKERFELNRKAAEYLERKYPQYVSVFHRKNGMTEVRLRDSRHKSKNKTRKRKR